MIHFILISPSFESCTVVTLFASYYKSFTSLAPFAATTAPTPSFSLIFVVLFTKSPLDLTATDTMPACVVSDCFVVQKGVSS